MKNRTKTVSKRANSNKVPSFSSDKAALLARALASREPLALCDGGVRPVDVNRIGVSREVRKALLGSIGLASVMWNQAGLDGEGVEDISTFLKRARSTPPRDEPVFTRVREMFLEAKKLIEGFSVDDEHSLRELISACRPQRRANGSLCDEIAELFVDDILQDLTTSPLVLRAIGNTRPRGSSPVDAVEVVPAAG